MDLCKKRYMIIACEVLFREICLCAAKCRSVVSIKFVDQGLHNQGQIKMPKELQAIIDGVEQDQYDAILLVYGLCNNGICGLRADIPLVVPRAHDCITLLLGSKERYLAYFNENPGTFFKSSGWNERDYDGTGTLVAGALALRDDAIYEKYVELYGREEADYLMEAMDPSQIGYKKIAFIDTGVGDVDVDRHISQNYADLKGWEFEELPGDTGLLFRMMNGEWSEDEFLVVPPRKEVAPSFDKTIIKDVDSEASGL